MEPEATQNIIHQKHPIPSSGHIHQSVSWSKDSFTLLMMISFTGRPSNLPFSGYKGAGVGWGGLQSILLPRVLYHQPTYT